MNLKEIVHSKNKIMSFSVITLMLLQTCINLFLVLNTKEGILKNVGSQTFAIEFYSICFI